MLLRSCVGVVADGAEAPRTLLPLLLVLPRRALFVTSIAKEGSWPSLFLRGVLDHDGGGSGVLHEYKNVWGCWASLGGGSLEVLQKGSGAAGSDDLRWPEPRADKMPCGGRGGGQRAALAKKASLFVVYLG